MACLWGKCAIIYVFYGSPSDHMVAMVACSASVFFECAMLKLPFRPRTYRRNRRGYYFYSPQSSTFIKSKMAATTILQTRTRFHPPKIRLHCRLTICKQKNTFAVITYVHYAKWTLFPDKLPNFPSFFSWSRNTHACYLSICSQHLTFF